MSKISAPPETVSVVVTAKCKYNPTEIEVKAGERYRIEVAKSESWRDWFINTDANGYNNPLASLLGMRVKDAKCFALCGSYGPNDAAVFAIGLATDVTMQRDGQLFLFANDSSGFYWNNSGSINAKITRLVE